MGTNRTYGNKTNKSDIWEQNEQIGHIGTKRTNRTYRNKTNKSDKCLRGLIYLLVLVT
jgi:hypothetical protein